MLFKSAERMIQSFKESEQNSLDNAISLILDGGKYILFFTHENNIYGASESSRVTFAKLMDENDEDNDEGFRKNAFFTGSDCVKLIQNKQGITMFGVKDLDKIKVILEPKKVREILIEKIKSE